MTMFLSASLIGQAQKQALPFTSLALLLSMVAVSSNAWAANTYPSNHQGPGSKLPVQAALSPANKKIADAPPLQGTVKESNLKAEAALREMESTSAYLKRAATDMITEVEQANFYLSNEPGESDLISTPTAADLMPPKKKWVDYVMKELADLIPILHNDINTIVVPDEKLPVVGPTMTQIQNTMDAVDASYKKLQAVTKGLKLDNLTIGRYALAIHDNVTKIEELERQAIHQLRELPDQGS